MRTASRSVHHGSSTALHEVHMKVNLVYMYPGTHFPTPTQAVQHTQALHLHILIMKPGTGPMSPLQVTSCSSGHSRVLFISITCMVLLYLCYMTDLGTWFARFHYFITVHCLWHDTITPTQSH